MKMKLLALAAVGVLALGACSDDDPFSEESRDDFMETCSSMGGSDSQCECTWDEITENASEDEARDFLEDEDAEAPAWLTDAFSTCGAGG